VCVCVHLLCKSSKSFMMLCFVVDVDVIVCIVFVMLLCNITPDLCLCSLEVFYDGCVLLRCVFGFSPVRLIGIS